MKNTEQAAPPPDDTASISQRAKPVGATGGVLTMAAVTRGPPRRTHSAGTGWGMERRRFTGQV